MKAGYEGIYSPTNTGTPQGGICSPILSNIGLHGLETVIKNQNQKLGIIRYADDFVITAKSRKELEKIIPRVKQWLLERGPILFG
jgi:RNA-directed DNA polymerase